MKMAFLVSSLGACVQPAISARMSAVTDILKAGLAEAERGQGGESFEPNTKTESVRRIFHMKAGGGDKLALKARSTMTSKKSGCSDIVTPQCPEIVNPDRWYRCEWANFANVGGIAGRVDFPGRGICVDVPEVQNVEIRRGGVTVMTDIDDTIICSGGGVAGKDTKCTGTKKKGIYPGVAEFQLALARGSDNVLEPAKVIPFTARPDELGLKKVLALKSGGLVPTHFAGVPKQHEHHKQIASWGMDIENAQYGDLVDFADWVKDTSGGTGLDLTPYTGMGFKKFSNWKNMVDAGKLSTPSAFVGDNGQGDLIAAQMMMKYSAGVLRGGSVAVKAAFIHDVMRSCLSDCKRQWAAIGIYLFDDYAHAASIAKNKGLISASSCQAVCASSPKATCAC